jgi:hypothetical protein
MRQEGVLILEIIFSASIGMNSNSKTHPADHHQDGQPEQFGRNYFTD